VIIEPSQKFHIYYDKHRLYVTGGTITVLYILTDTCAYKVAERLQTHLKNKIRHMKFVNVFITYKHLHVIGLSVTTIYSKNRLPS